MKKEYLKRIVDKELDTLLESSGAVMIKGTKWSGKTRSAEERAASVLYLQNPDEQAYYSRALDIKPSTLLEGDTPRLIDEWQLAPELWNSVRFAVDRRNEAGQFILTGSVVVKDEVKKRLHSGTGRIAQFLMRPMTLFESGESNGSVSLKSLFEGENIRGISSLELEGLAFALVRGGWPAAIGEKESIALQHARNYVNSTIYEDISRVDDVERDPQRAYKLMRSLARNVSTPAKLETIKGDIVGDDPGNTFADNTLYSYLNALRRLYVLEDLPAWSPNMRSKVALRVSPKRHFVDPSIAAYLLDASPERLMKDFNTFGLLFESLCIRDLRVYAQANDGFVYHYRDKDDMEVDAIIELANGRWGAVEIKMGFSAVEEGIKNLFKLREKVDTDEMGEPAFMMVLTASEYAYRREDGVYVIPIGCLKD
jgi:predicted AAA+ superfamily ATPase